MGKAKKTEDETGFDPNDHGLEFPQDGDPAYEEPGANEGDEGQGNEPEGQKSEAPKSDPLEARLAQLEDQNRQLLARLDQASSHQGSAETKKEPEPDPEPDWEQLLFTDPKKALDLHAQRIRDEVTKEVRQEYARDQNQRAFWSAFYEKHPDLKDDHDLVQTEMNKNIQTLAPMPAEAAADRLAELTRQRILRYSGNKPPQGKKVTVEGNSPPVSKAKKEEPQAPTTLADLLKARRQQRQKGVAA